MMHDRWDDIHKAIDALSAQEKLELMEEVRRSLQRAKQDLPEHTVMTAKQKQAVMELLEEVEALPRSAEPDDGLVVSRDHDDVLYGRSLKTGPHERRAQ